MSIRSWSLTRFWAMSSCCWLAAVVVASLSADLRGGRLAALVLAAAPGFLAGAWAGSHPEIRDWPTIRLISMWLLPTLGVVGANDALAGSGGVVALTVFAPVAILTVRWVELKGGPGSRAVSRPPVSSDTQIPVTTPGNGTPIA